MEIRKPPSRRLAQGHAGSDTRGMDGPAGDSTVPELPEAFHQQLIERVPCALIVLDVDRRVIFFNRSAERLTGYSAGEMLGASCETLQTTLRGPAENDVLSFLCPFAREEDEWEEECELTRKDGSTVTVVRKAGPVHDQAGRRIGGIQALMDVSGIKRASAELLRLREEVARLGRFGELIGSSSAMRKLYEIVEMVADTTASVVIEGPTGVGKELIARTLHDRSSRRDGPYLAVNCGALPEGLVEAELFGHVAGAFTGAASDRKGRFEEAHRGTLLLDEIGDLPAPAQVKLLRAVQEGEITRVGESTPRQVDVRLVAATHRNLKTLVAEGDFREDLFYRLQVVRIVIPPLRDRPEDIPELVAAFIEQFNARYGRRIQRCDPTAMNVLERHPWPGNVRQLQHALEHAFVVTDPAAETLGVQSLPGDLLAGDEALDLAHPASREPSPAGKADERTDVLRALRQADGNKSQAARLLGITRAGLYKKLRRLGLS